MSKVPLNGVITIENTAYSWEIKHLGGSSSMYDNYRGLSVSVVLERGRTKELVIEFPFREFLWDRPSSNSEFLEKLSKSIQDALQLGWIPTKRGKTFLYRVTENLTE